MRFTPGSSPRLAFFPFDGNAWRIDWFGDVAYPNRRESYKQPAICVAISKVTQDIEGQFRCVNSYRSQRQIWAPVGLLPNFRIGDIWRNGLLHQQEVTPTEIFQGLDINRRSNRVVKAGISMKDRSFILPVKKHPWHMRHTPSHCLIVKLPDTRQLIIPCVELIRFYFGSSSSLLAALFTPPLIQNRLYSEAHYHPGSGRLRLKLALGISGYAASDIGRLHLDQHAWKAASEIGISLLAGSTLGGKAYPYTHFPFTGHTTLTVIGEWLPLGDQPDQSFLVHRIQSCSHPFPFRTLAYDMERTSRFEGLSKQVRRIAALRPASQFSKVTQKPSVADQDPSKRFMHSTWHVWQGVKFPDLETKNVFKKTPWIKQDQDPPAKHRHSSNANTWAVAEPTGTQRLVRPMELGAPQQINAFDSAPEFLQEPLSALLAIPSISITVLTESHLNGWSVAINAMQDDNRSIDGKLYLKDGNSKRIRQACVLYIADGKQSVGLLALLEDKPTHGYLLKELGSTTEDVTKALAKTAIKFITERPSPALGAIRDLAKRYT